MKTLATIASVAAFRIGASLGGLGLLYIAAQLFSGKVVGAISLMVATSLGLSTIARFGFDVVAIKYLPSWIAYKDWDRVKSFSLLFGLRTAAFLAAIILFYWLIRREDSADLLSVCAMAISISFLAFGSAWIKSALKPVTSSAFEPGYAMALAGLVLLIAAISCSDTISVIDAQRIVAIAIAMYSASSVLLLSNALPWAVAHWKFSATSVPFRNANVESVSFAFIAMVGYFYSHGYVWLSGELFDLEVVGYVAIVARLAFAVNFSMMISNTVYNPQFSVAWRQGDKNRIEQLASKSLRSMLILSVVPTGTMLLFPRWVLGLFNVTSETATTCLLLMATAQLVNVVTGNAAAILNLSGGERMVRNISIAHLILGTAVGLLVAPMYGVEVLVAGVAVALMSQNVMLVIALWVSRRINIYRYVLR